MVRNLFEGLMPTDDCPFCGAPGCSCNDYLNEVPLLNPGTGSQILVESDVYENVEVDGNLVPRIKWKRGEYITRDEAERLGVRDVPPVVRLTRERRALQEALEMQSMGENKMWRPAEDKAEPAHEDKAEAAVEDTDEPVEVEIVVAPIIADADAEAHEV